MKKKLLPYVLSAVMTLSLTAPAAFGNQESEPVKAEAAQSQDALTQTEDPDIGGVWKTDIRMSIQRENEIRKAAGMSLRDWDEAAAKKKQEGKDAPLTMEAVLEANPDAQILEEDGAIYFIEQADALGDVSDALEAYRAAYSAAALMGGNELADLRLWQQMDINDVRVYSFQQISDSIMVLGSSMKIAVKDGKVCAIFSSLDPESGKEETIAGQDQVEDAVRNRIEQEGSSGELLPEYTDRIRYIPSVLADLNLDKMTDDPVPDEVRWVVYSTNDDEEYPYTAHYFDLAGTYLESLSVEAPGSDEALCGFRRQRIFDGMEPDIWTGEIRGGKDDGDVKTVTLPVMRDGEGSLYLGDVVRRIAVADFAKAVYDDDHQLVLVQSDGDEDFDNEDLYMYYNYLNAWDFYADMGWISPDGEGSDVVILKGLCTSDGTPFENAASLGMIQGWQMFGYTPYSATGEPLGLGRGLDVMAHEYTHTFTSTIMNCNLYENDQGAINEAMSDIMGNLVETILGETDDTRWLLGEQTGKAIRSMSDPVAYQQPAYVWDKYYGPQTEIANESNDRGGVHINSSLLNHIAATLCLDDSMQYEDAIRFWVMTAGGLTPKTDYPQICALMRWAIRESGNGAYSEALDQVIEKEKLDREEIPEKLPYNRKIVKLTLPDTQAFADEYWTLMLIQLNTETVGNAAVTALQLGLQVFRDAEDAEAFGRILSDFLNSIHLDGNKIKIEKSDDEDAVMDAVTQALLSSISRVVERSMAWRSSVGEDIAFVTDDFPTFYILLNISEAGTKTNGAAVLIGDRWVDLSAFIGVVQEITGFAGNTEETEAETEQRSILKLASELTPDQWATLFDLAQAVVAAIHPDGSKAEETQTDASEQEQLGADLIELALSALDYAMADEEEREEGLLLSAKVQELPTNGLEKVKLVRDF